MLKRIAVALTLALAGASLALAAAAKGTVVSVKDKTVVIKVEGAVASWVKKGVQVQINHKYKGKIMDVNDATVTVSSPKAEEMKAGEGITFDKALAAVGC